ncbi:methyltransferase domain-containing protein [Nocardioides sp. YIM 152315]|uniref:methyltransferase domain-containing protein n=1 Tax=Nocardioides sp. YIM 152315 TaxID=3031760 RepID=UPI0023DB0C1E|nr:methyltransferase domain-containing protein [Nocardioides sp. YIM 152315]MDF1606184.1 methyltransferase domain-containing protein [Nocardioides sp. YIM 152315]
MRDLLRRVRRATGQPAPTSAVGMVEEFSREQVLGWVSVPADAAPTRVDLFLGPIRVTSTYATADGAMSQTSARKRGRTPSIRSPRGDRRNSRAQIRTFSFKIHGLWTYANRGSRLRVEVDGRPLPIHGHGMFVKAPRSGEHDPELLQERLGSGWVLGRTGTVQLSKQLDTEWQAAVMDLYTTVRTILREEHGHDLFLTFGTLLGAIREGDYIGHDNDFDVAYVSRERSGPAAAAELVSVARTLIDRGYRVEAMSSCLHVVDAARSKNRIDIFHTYVDADGELQHPFGYTGTTPVTGEWQGSREIDFSGGRALVPVRSEELLAAIYGDDWRRPKTGFDWKIERRGEDVSGQLTPAQRTTVYWADYYAHNGHTEGSSFAQFVQDRHDTAGTVVDIGCGDGRDSFHFGSVGRTVVGLDRSDVGVAHARDRALGAGLGERVTFEVCDLGDAERLAAVLDATRGGDGAGPVVHYTRFVLHAITEDVQETLLDVLGDTARPGDLLAAEFRTDKDAHRQKAHPKHYRRYQDAEAFVADLRRRGWELLYEVESDGLAPWGEEDPVLCRVIARRP